MAIKKTVHKFDGGHEHMVVPEFTFATNVGTAAKNTQNTGDALAQMIVDAWTNVPFYIRTARSCHRGGQHLRH